MHHSLPIIPANDREPYVVVGATQLLPVEDPVNLLLLVAEPSLQMRKHLPRLKSRLIFLQMKGMGRKKPPINVLLLSVVLDMEAIHAYFQ
ncbi:hypothetical protein CXB51_001719 [Gossypium anomalum]|uniref:Uncharacterized protein n=1 Tax=Gossypium anomalum TaxID=47600 RepID=A0A8J5ZK67_9ROSI|nr:hypothetical protein CXB51_001719 [Gossypium anomalum]